VLQGIDPGSDFENFNFKIAMNSSVGVTLLLCAAFLVPFTDAVVLEMLGFGAAGIIKGSVAAGIQSAAALGNGYVGTALLGFGAAGIAKGSVAAALQSAGATGASIIGAQLIPAAVVGGAVYVGAAYMLRRR